MNTVKIDKAETKIIAHRGLSGIECENTNAAFVAAGNRSYYGIETDVHVTKDGKIIVFHDDKTDRMTGKKKIVENTRYSALKKMLLKNPRFEEYRTDYHMPDLKEYIGICKKYGKVSVLEIKNPTEEKYLKVIVDQIKEMDYLENTVFISFSIDNLIALRKLLPEQKMQYLIGNPELGEDVYDNLQKYRLDLDVKYHGLKKEVIDRVHSMGLEVNCWTCDDNKDAEKLMSMGVDYITTNILE